jgi:hypothetical protein
MLVDHRLTKNTARFMKKIEEKLREKNVKFGEFDLDLSKIKMFIVFLL